MRLGAGPVFAYEWLLATRRWQLYAVRAGFVLVILAGMYFTLRAAPNSAPAGTTLSRQELARYGETFYLTIVSMELAIVLLVAPAVTAGAICVDKARGTLDHMLVTNLSSAEIVLGKLAMRLVPVLSLVACVLPLMAISSLLGGIDSNAVFGSFLAAIGCAAVACTLALALSVWGRKPQDVIILTYFIVALWLFCRYLVTLALGNLGFSTLAFTIGPVSDLIDYSNPYSLVWAPYLGRKSTSWYSYLAFLVGCLIIAAMLAALATWRIRAVARRRFDRRPARSRRRKVAPAAPRTKRSFLPGPTLDGNPVFWREWYRSKPSRLMRLVWVVYWGMGATFVLITFYNVFMGPASRDMIAIMNVFQVGVGLLLLAVTATTSLVEERIRGSLDILLSTPISTRSVVLGKWWGAFRCVPQLLFAPALTTFILACESGRWFSYFNFLGLLLAYCAVVVSLGLALATWQSRLERAVALGVGALVLLAIAWPALVLAVMLPARAADPFIISMVMGSPLYGVLFATSVVADGVHSMPGSSTDIWVGCFLWTAVLGAAATALFTIVVATFDRFLGRMPESVIEWGRAGGFPKKPSGFAEQRHDLAEFPECGPAITGGA